MCINHILFNQLHVFESFGLSVSGQPQIYFFTKDIKLTPFLNHPPATQNVTQKKSMYKFKNLAKRTILLVVFILRINRA